MSSLLKNLWDKGELPEIRTSIEIDNRTLIRTGVAVIIVAAIIILLSKRLK